MIFNDDANACRLIVSAFLCEVDPRYEKYRKFMIEQILTMVYMVGYKFDLQWVVERGVTPYSKYRGKISYSDLVQMHILFKERE